MDNSSVICDTWLMFKEHVDKKQMELCAEKFIDMCADYGVSDEMFKECFGHCNFLDGAIKYYLDMDEDIDLDYDENEWDD